MKGQMKNVKSITQCQKKAYLSSEPLKPSVHGSMLCARPYQAVTPRDDVNTGGILPPTDSAPPYTTPIFDDYTERNPGGYADYGESPYDETLDIPPEEEPVPSPWDLASLVKPCSFSSGIAATLGFWG